MNITEEEEFLNSTLFYDLNCSNWNCTNDACYWKDYDMLVDWDYYTHEWGNCSLCQELCEEDSNCWAVECGGTYCAWWAPGTCLPEQAHSVEDRPYKTCRDNSLF